MVGQWDRGATIANTTQRPGVFTVHELVVARLGAAAAASAAAGTHFLFRLPTPASSLLNM